eukprot:scaffold187707_cov28-Tisochrysis_lutea.AAC.8
MPPSLPRGTALVAAPPSPNPPAVSHRPCALELVQGRLDPVYRRQRGGRFPTRPLLGPLQAEHALYLAAAAPPQAVPLPLTTRTMPPRVATGCLPRGASLPSLRQALARVSISLARPVLRAPPSHESPARVPRRVSSSSRPLVEATPAIPCNRPSRRPAWSLWPTFRRRRWQARLCPLRSPPRPYTAIPLAEQFLLVPTAAPHPA